METDHTINFYTLFSYIFKFYNTRLFNGQLSVPIITVIRKKSVFGFYSHKRWKKDNLSVDEIALNPQMFQKYPLVEICQTIVHEMCHQWQCHFGKPSRQGYHNDEWANKMEEIGLMPSATGKPGGARLGQTMADYYIEDGRFITVTNELLKDDILKELYLERFSDPHDQNEVQVDTPSDNGFSDLEPFYPENSQSPSVSGSKPQKAPRPQDEPLMAAKSKEKTKYTCDICDINVWGKPELKIICGSCKSTFEEVKPKSTETIL